MEQITIDIRVNKESADVSAECKYCAENVQKQTAIMKQWKVS